LAIVTTPLANFFRQQLRDDAAMDATRACRKAADVTQVIVVPAQFVDNRVGGGGR
jgi:hypothetical protein